MEMNNYLLINYNKFDRLMCSDSEDRLDAVT